MYFLSVQIQMLALITHAPTVVHAPHHSQVLLTLVIAEVDTPDLNVKYVKIFQLSLNPSLFFRVIIDFLISIVDPCFNNPCINGATCQSLGNGYTCLCPQSYSGLNCQTCKQTEHQTKFIQKLKVQIISFMNRYRYECLPAITMSKRWPMYSLRYK